MREPLPVTQHPTQFPCNAYCGQDSHCTLSCSPKAYNAAQVRKDNEDFYAPGGWRVTHLARGEATPTWWWGQAIRHGGASAIAGTVTAPVIIYECPRNFEADYIVWRIHLAPKDDATWDNTEGALNASI